MNVSFTFLLNHRKNIPLKYWRKLLMTAGIGALQSAIGRVKKRLPNKDIKISVVYEKRDGTIDWPPEERINKNGVLVVPEPLSEIEWELYSALDSEQKLP
jgi:hypothetical protein